MDNLKLSARRIKDFNTLEVEGWECIVDGDGIFKGLMANGLKHGHGVWRRSDGKYFAGKWQRGVLTVLEATLNFDTLYYGDFKDGFKHGKGVLSFGDSVKYCGEFVRDKYEGQGRLCRLIDKSVYIGAFRNGLAHGAGTLTLQNVVIKGDWLNGETIGDMDVKYTLNGQMYCGQFTNNLRNGTGIYSGGIINNKPTGQGVMTSAGGTMYDGEWVNGTREVWEEDQAGGPGKRILVSGEVQTGMFQAGVLDGHGHIVYPDGSECVGDNITHNRFSGSNQILNRNGKLDIDLSTTK
eukprot:gene34758-42872_t